MRIAVAPNAFRGSLTAVEATNCIIAGLQASALNLPDTLPMPLADGGDGTLEVLLRGLGGERLTVAVTGPDGSPVQADMGLLADGQTAVIEMARASGVELLPRSKRNPLITTTFGTGELIKAGLDRGFRRFLFGIGGSATVDGGAGCMEALGVRFLDASGNPIPRGGGGLAALASIDASALRTILEDGIEVVVLSDVTNPLIGPNGAARIFGPQKGADPAMVEILEANLTHFAEVVQRDLGIEIADIPSGGAAGGFGAGLMAFLSAELAPGGKTVINLLGYDQQLPGVDLVITGEGKLDGQTVGGKAVQSIAQVADRIGVQVVALAGTIDADRVALRKIGIQSAWSIVPGPCTLDEAVAHAAEWLTQSATELGNFLALSRPT